MNQEMLHLSAFRVVIMTRLPPVTGIKVSISEISPLPKCTKERKRKRAPQKSQVLSSTPCKSSLEEKESEKFKRKLNA
jgi:hypothetical protein